MSLEPLMRVQVPADMPQPSRAATPIDRSNSYWWYCLQEDHPGVPTYSQQPLDIRRIFGTETDQGCPTCPTCQKQTSCVPCAGPHLPPASIVEYARWYQESQIRGGIGR